MSDGARFFFGGGGGGGGEQKNKKTNKKKNWQPKFGPNGPTSGPKLVFLPFPQVWFIRFP